jgi:putative transposase
LGGELVVQARTRVVTRHPSLERGASTMARLPRLTLPGVPHHIIHRGHNGDLIFLDDLDRRRWLEVATDAAETHEVQVHAYVLMSNHVHLLATPAQAHGVGRMMQSLGRQYVQWFNHRHQRRGTLWEGRFRSTLIDSERYFMACMRYIEANPVRAGIVAAPWDYRWSSCAHHLGQVKDALVSDHPLFWQLGNTPFEREAAYRDLLAEILPSDLSQQITSATLRGWALGSTAFLQELANQNARRSSAKPRGRPSTRSEPSPA